MVARAGGYYRAAFKGARVVMQGDPLSPTIFNVVVDAVVMHWVTVMVEDAEERGECGQEDGHQNVLFYMDNGLVALSDPQWIQDAFSTLVGLFDRVVLRTNAGKTVGMIYRPSTITNTQCLTTASTTTSNMVGERGYPCVTPQDPLNVAP